MSMSRTRNIGLNNYNCFLSKKVALLEEFQEGAHILPKAKEIEDKIS
jgi:hypothetical protein